MRTTTCVPSLSAVESSPADSASPRRYHPRSTPVPCPATGLRTAARRCSFREWQLTTQPACAKQAGTQRRLLPPQAGTQLRPPSACDCDVSSAPETFLAVADFQLHPSIYL